MLDHFEEIQAPLERLFQLPFSALLIAPRFSGKTYMLIELLNSSHIKDSFDEVYVFSETATLDDSWKKLKNKDVFLTDAYSNEKLERLLESVKKEKELNPNKAPQKILIVLDDLEDRFTPGKRNVLSNLAIRGRHYGISYIFTSQKYRFVPQAIRSNSLVKVFWRINNQKELAAIVEENFSKLLSEKRLESLLDSETEEYNYLALKQHKSVEIYRGKSVSVTKL